MLVCDKHGSGKTRIARYELLFKDMRNEESVFSLKKHFCADCGDKLMAIILAFIDLKPGELLGQIGDISAAQWDFLEQIQRTLVRKTREMEKKESTSVKH